MLKSVNVNANPRVWQGSLSVYFEVVCEKYYDPPKKIEGSIGREGMRNWRTNK